MRIEANFPVETVAVGAGGRSIVHQPEVCAFIISLPFLWGYDPRYKVGPYRRIAPVGPRYHTADDMNVLSVLFDL